MQPESSTAAMCHPPEPSPPFLVIAGLEQNARLLTPVIGFERIVLPPRNFSLASPQTPLEAIPACDVHGEEGDWRGEARKRRHRKYMDAWNEAGVLPWAQLEQALAFLLELPSTYFPTPSYNICPALTSQRHRTT